MARILVVDDDALCSAMLSEDLVRLGHSPLNVGSAQAALRLLVSGEQVDLVVTDMLMPEMDGVELIQALRQDHLALPVIAISSGGIFEAATILKVARILGADRILRKPVDAVSLGEAISTLLATGRIEDTGDGTAWFAPAAAIES